MRPGEVARFGYKESKVCRWLLFDAGYWVSAKSYEDAHVKAFRRSLETGGKPFAYNVKLGRLDRNMAFGLVSEGFSRFVGHTDLDVRDGIWIALLASSCMPRTRQRERRPRGTGDRPVACGWHVGAALCIGCN
jgi:hypothetical protein